MAYTGIADAGRQFAPGAARPAPTARRRQIRRSAWRRAFARLLIARRHAVEREVAEFARLSGLELPAGARRLRRIVQSRAAA